MAPPPMTDMKVNDTPLSVILSSEADMVVNAIISPPLDDIKSPSPKQISLKQYGILDDITWCYPSCSPVLKHW